MSKQWDVNAVQGSDILGNGSCFGDITGQVATNQIGFVRGPARPMSVQDGVSNKGRSQADASRGEQKSRWKTWRLRLSGLFLLALHFAAGSVR